MLGSYPPRRTQVRVSALADYYKASEKSGAFYDFEVVKGGNVGLLSASADTGLSLRFS